MSRNLNLIFFGLTITSGWGNGHATTYRALLRGLRDLGHSVTFFEKDVPWYRNSRDSLDPEWGDLIFYSDWNQAIEEHLPLLRSADLITVGSYVPDGALIIDRINAIRSNLFAFYDIDTPITLADLRNNGSPNLRVDQIPLFDIYFSFTGGGALKLLAEKYHARMPRALYCSVDTKRYMPRPNEKFQWDLGYLGTYSNDRQIQLDRLLLSAARQWAEGRFAIIGPMYPKSILWPPNVERRDHLSPDEHASFYTRQRYTLNITRRPMRRFGYSPSVRLFEAAACAVPIISDWWPGLDQFFTPGREILISNSGRQTLEILQQISEKDRLRIGALARGHVLTSHSGRVRASEFVSYYDEARRDLRNRRRLATIRKKAATAHQQAS